MLSEKVKMYEMTRRCIKTHFTIKGPISRVSDQNGTSRLYIMLDIHHSGQEPLIYAVMCDVAVSTSAFLACHQCYCAGLSLAWGLNLWTLVCGIF